MKRLAAWIVLASLVTPGCRNSPAISAQPDGAASLEVEAATVRLVEVPNTLALIGSLNAQEHVVVSAETGGTVAEVGVDFGDAVDPGTLLLRLDDTEVALRAAAARAGLAQTDAMLEQARANHQRAAALLKQQVVSKESFESATRELRVAEANRDAAAKQLALAEKHVNDTIVRSPITGFVAARHVSVGQYVSAYTPVVELVVVNPLKLRVDLPERFVGAVRPGLPVSVAVEAFPGEQFAGVVTRVGSALDPATRTLPVESAIANPDVRLKPGQFAQVRLDFGTHEALVVPRPAVDTFAGSHRAFVVHPDGRVEARSVTPGADLGEEVVILTGLAQGETVAVSHLERLGDGIQVTPIARPAS